MKNNDDTRISYDYSDVPRSPNETRKVQMLGLDMHNLSENKLGRGNDLCFTLHCKANAYAKNIGFRFEIFYLDDTIAGTVFSDKPVSAEQGQVFDLSIRLSTKNLAPGKYTSAVLAYEYDQYGNQVGVDRVAPAMSFELTPSNNELIWLHQYWGHVQFDDMIIQDIVFH